MAKNDSIKFIKAKSDGFTNNFTDKKKRELYERMWFRKELPASFDEVMIKPSEWRKKKSKNSYRFCSAGEIEVSDTSNEKDAHNTTCKLLKEIFLDGNDREKLFDDKFEQACSGSGKEYLKISTMHSSSLCALLFFYGVKEGNELTLNLNGKNYIFSESVFEYKSPVLDIRYPSNMDVVLLGKEKDNYKEEVALFLESKFSEYIDCQTKHGKSKDKKTGDYKGIDKGYLTNEFSEPLYRKDILRKMGLERKPVHEGLLDEINDDFELCLQDGETFYIHGIKQMISHYVGVKNVLSALQPKGKKRLLPDDKEEQDSQRIVNAYLDENTKIILGEILFDFPEFKDEREHYTKKYEILADIINEINKKTNKNDSRFEMLSTPLLYSDIMRSVEDAGILDKNVKEYYRIK